MCEVFVASDHIGSVRSRKHCLIFFAWRTAAAGDDLQLAVDSTGVAGRSGSPTVHPWKSLTAVVNQGETRDWS